MRPHSASGSSRMRGHRRFNLERRCTEEEAYLIYDSMQDVMSKPMPDFREGSIIKGQILEVVHAKCSSTSDTSPRASFR